MAIGMTADHMDAILKAVGAKGDREGWHILPDGLGLTLHIAHDGASMTVSRVEAIRQDGDLVYARNPKRELYVVGRSDVFAIAVDGEPTAGKVARRAGFG
ncbi:MAG: hypothetical protein ABSF69_15270 [Polyangiaceae bacterium]|jgi:hypothetical protein